MKKWRIENPLIWKELRRRNFKKKYSTPKGKLNHLMSKYLWDALHSQKNGMKWESIVGYSSDILFNHLKKTVPIGYTWDDFLSGELHLDHIIPRSAFNFKSQYDIDFKRCWALENLRLLPAKENMAKGSRLEKPFQPSLAFGGYYATSGIIHDHRTV
jgi:5-methylcytosine-specific restriction endonuclease McrA